MRAPGLSCPERAGRRAVEFSGYPNKLHTAAPKEQSFLPRGDAGDAPPDAFGGASRVPPSPLPRAVARCSLRRRPKDRPDRPGRAMPIEVFTEEWCIACCEALNRSEAYRTSAAGWE